MTEISIEKDVMTVKLKGELDHHTCRSIREDTDMKTEATRPKILRLDFSEVKFMDSSGVGLVMGRYRQMTLLGGRVEVVNIPPHLDKMFRISGLSALGVIR